MLRIRRLKCEQLEVRCLMTAGTVIGSQEVFAGDSPVQAALASTQGLADRLVFDQDVGQVASLSRRFSDVNSSYFFTEKSSGQFLSRDSNTLLNSLPSTFTTSSLSIVHFCCSWLAASTSTVVSTAGSSSGGRAAGIPVFVAVSPRQSVVNPLLETKETVFGSSFELSSIAGNTYRVSGDGGVMGSLLTWRNLDERFVAKPSAIHAREHATIMALLRDDSTDAGFIELNDSFSRETLIASPGQYFSLRQSESDSLLGGKDHWNGVLSIGNGVGEWAFDVTETTIADGLHEKFTMDERLVRVRPQVVRSSSTWIKATDRVFGGRTSTPSESAGPNDRIRSLRGMIWLPNDRAVAECENSNELRRPLADLGQWDGLVDRLPSSWTIGQAQAFELDRSDVSPTTIPQQVVTPQSRIEVVHEEPKEVLPAPQAAAICIPLILAAAAARPLPHQFTRQALRRLSKKRSTATAPNEMK
ncbi:MAG: hypothetical protein O2931_00270 [Planctomycetota bacterium]|nr:hypothetical protein [Planctomycetota bacterium]MDA1177208.1 hypothetical protein [Planctomycetota bacterium]